MTIHYSSTVQSPGPLPGCIFSADARGTANGSFRSRDAVSQESKATIAGAFNGSRDLGFHLDGAIIHSDNAASAAAWITALGAQAIAATLGVEYSLDGADLHVLFSDTLDHTLVGDYEPDSPDLTLDAFSTVTAAVPADSVAAGMGLVWLDRASRILESPRPASTIRDFAGVVTLASRLPPSVITGLAGEADRMVDGQPLEAARRFVGTVAAGDGETIAAGDPVYLGRITGEAGYFYPADDGGNTRLLITGAQFMQDATGSGLTAGVQVMFE